jgi:hypothetical protein
MNREWKEILMRRNLPGKLELNEKKKTQFFMASYDLDRFRRYVLESRFLKVFDIPEELAGTIGESDEKLMDLAFKYLKFILGLEQSIKVRDQYLKK